MEWIRVPLADLDEDGRAVIEPEGHEIAVFLVDGKPHAFANTCPHEGNPLVEGELLGSTTRVTANAAAANATCAAAVLRLRK